MRHTQGQVIEVDSREEFDQRIAMGVRSLAGWHLRSVDLRGWPTSGGLPDTTLSVSGALFMGCRFDPGIEAQLEAAGAVVFPSVPASPVDTFRSRLYTPDDLYDTPEYPRSFDAQVYAWSKQHPTAEITLAQALHDHAIDEALVDWVDGRQIVGIMGGHALQRGEPAYADAVRLGRLLAHDATVASGGGPGAMEAANLGAWMSARTAEETSEALAALAAVPSFAGDIGAWASAALRVRNQWSDGTESLGVPTWHYGHEPPGAFATAIAKYFRNATREAILLAVCNAGIVFLPGAAGTVQEVFQDACENYYADPSSVAPMVLVGRSHWCDKVPAWPLLSALARERAMESYVHLVDTVDEAAEIVGQMRTA